jgi:hypothetical protein
MSISICYPLDCSVCQWPVGPHNYLGTHPWKSLEFAASSRWDELHYLIYEGDSNKNLKSAIKIQNTAPLSCKLTIMILMV